MKIVGDVLSVSLHHTDNTSKTAIYWPKHVGKNKIKKFIIKLMWICWLFIHFINLIDADTRNILTFFINYGTKKYEKILARLYVPAFHSRRRYICSLLMILLTKSLAIEVFYLPTNAQ